MSRIYVTCKLEYSKQKSTVTMYPTEETKSNWKEECQSLFSSYIDSEYVRETIQAPKEAARDVFRVLASANTKQNLNFEMDDDNECATVAGERSAVEAVKKKIDRIFTQTQTTETRELPQRDYFAQVVQKKLRSETSIELSPKMQKLPIGSVGAPDAMADQIAISFSHNRTLTLKKGDIVKEKANILVNAADGNLLHGGGLAGALNEASERKLQLHCNKYMETKRKGKAIPAGEVAVTYAGGKLACDLVIHAVGPEGYKHSKPQCEHLVKQVIRNTLEAAERYNATSIVLPAISCGVYRVSKDLVAQCIIDTILGFKYTRPSPILSDIRIVILEGPTHSCFARHFEEKLKLWRTGGI
jgi:O-acetyl-ADP-ribose deacetylase (regulator of RNase III)